MARPTKPPEEKRDDRLNPRLTTPERAQIEHNAAALGISPSEFLRRRGLSYRLPANLADQQAAAALGAALNRIGVNLNQIARHFNTPGAPPALKAELQALIERINGELDRIYGPGSDRRGPQL